mmetsp:Transcript_18728/g.64490  ORF Transcript_18728/g.64490 Transcript_18728/m.64490 type:complete len:208 (+) Transcript_18728:101-724(+)
MTALAKPDWSDQTKIPKRDWAALLGRGSFSFTVLGFQEKDARYEADAVVIRLRRRPDGALVCDEPQCQAPVFGATAHTQSQHSAFKHLRAYHRPGSVTLTKLPTGAPARLVQQKLFVASIRVPNLAPTVDKDDAVEDDGAVDDNDAPQPRFVLQTLSVAEKEAELKTADDARLKKALQKPGAPPSSGPLPAAATAARPTEAQPFAEP